MAHKRIIDSISEKANALSHATQGPSDIQDKVKIVEQRYSNLLDASQRGIAHLEALVDVYQQFSDLQKAYQEYQKQQWEKLNHLSDYSGNKAALQAKLVKIMQIQDNISEGELKLHVLEEHVSKNSKIITGRAQEAMERDLNNLK